MGKGNSIHPISKNFLTSEIIDTDMVEFRMTVPVQLIVLSFLVIVVLSLSVSVFNPIFAQNLPMNKTSTSNLGQLTFDARGPIASMQNDGNGSWITWGDWKMVHNTSNGMKVGSNPFSFNATITKVKPDNSESLKYKVYDFKLAKSDIKPVDESSILVFNGTGTVSSKSGTFSQVPINIMITDRAPVTASIDRSGSAIPSWLPKGGTISILFPDKVFGDQFGNSPIYGIVKKAKS